MRIDAIHLKQMLQLMETLWFWPIVLLHAV